MRTRTAILALVVTLVIAAGPPARTDDADDSACSSCHEDVTQLWADATHGKLATGDWFGKSQGCTTCHGAVARHLDDPSTETIRRFPGDTSPEADNEVCLGCHVRTLSAWPAGPHAAAALACTDCHVVHPKANDPRVRAAGAGRRGAADIAQRCYGCHPETRSQMRLPSRHPVLEGKMSCASCHDPHGANEGLLRTDLRLNDLCLSCHPAQQGPFVFQHDPVEESCLICHRPHGSVADNLLAQTEPFLCLQCHEAHFHAGLQGHPASTRLIGGQLRRNPFGDAGWKYGILTKCSQCHSSIHGSDLPSQGVSGGGRAMYR